MMRNGLEVGMTFTCNLVIVLIAALRACSRTGSGIIFWGLDLVDPITDITHPMIFYGYIMFIVTQ